MSRCGPQCNREIPKKSGVFLWGTQTVEEALQQQMGVVRVVGMLGVMGVVGVGDSTQESSQPVFYFGSGLALELWICGFHSALKLTCYKWTGYVSHPAKEQAWKTILGNVLNHLFQAQKVTMPWETDRWKRLGDKHPHSMPFTSLLVLFGFSFY